MLENIITVTFYEYSRPGTYNPNWPCCKRVQYHGGFGGRPIDLPDIPIKSTIRRNTEKVKH